MLGKGTGALGAIALLLAGHALAAADELKVGGTGSATGVLQRMSAAYNAAHPGDKVEVVFGLGSSGGIAAAAEGAIGVSVSGRALKAEEKAAGLQSARLLDTPFLFVTSYAQPQKLSKKDIVAIFDGGLNKWPDGRDIRPVLRPKADSVTPFLISAFEGMQPAMDKLRQRQDVPVAATDQDNKDTAEKVPDSFAGMTLVQFVTESPRLRPIALDGADASVATMESGAYPLKMTLHTVVKADPSPVVKRFMSFMHSPDGAKIIRESGGVPARAD
jgi:phosphate transport system substrate-binding protein